MARKIVFTSGKGGVGKTTVSANVAIKLAQSGYRVVLVDTDFGLNNVDVVTGMEKHVMFDMVDALEGRCRPKQALTQHKKYKNLYIIASNKFDGNKHVSPQAVKLILDTLAPAFDYILIDCPAGIDSGFHRAVATADEAIVVATPHVSSIRDADKVISVLTSYKLKSVSLILNMVRGDLVVEGEVLSPDEICELLKIKLIGIIPDCDDVYLLNDSIKSSRAFKLVASNIDKGQEKLLNVTGKWSGIFGAIKRGIRKSV